LGSNFPHHGHHESHEFPHTLALGWSRLRRAIERFHSIRTIETSYKINCLLPKQRKLCPTMVTMAACRLLFAVCCGRPWQHAAPIWLIVGCHHLLCCCRCLFVAWLLHTQGIQMYHKFDPTGLLSSCCSGSLPTIMLPWSLHFVPWLIVAYFLLLWVNPEFAHHDTQAYSFQYGL
jgi:hypothetical protein